jgi:thioredoxin reductase/Pyruvate/2-oxoacid:ferredoxin oxidoreductase delta subunit
VSWALLVVLIAVLGTALIALRARRAAVEELRDAVGERELARARGSHEARLLYPVPDLSRCIGCGTCVAACPEDGVLEVIHGQALVVHGARCVGHGRCAAECPVGAIALTFGDLSDRRDLPALEESLEAVGVPGLYLAGEVTGFALVRTAIEHGKTVAREVAGRLEGAGDSAEGDERAPLDLCIVGAGPAGLACALEAKRRGVRALMIDQEGPGGTVAKYPRRKLVMTQPVELPLHGRLERTEYTREELLELWERILVEQEVPLKSGVTLTGISRGADGVFDVTTSAGVVRARNVCLALGRRGTPRKLGVPGEELQKVAYGLLDAEGLAGRHVLVVGGGDSAVEAALGLADQEGTTVTLSYRRAAFSRLKARNDARIGAAIERGRIDCRFESVVERIDPESIDLLCGTNGQQSRLRVPNDDVFVLAGGTPPLPLLEACGVSFDPADRPPEELTSERGAGLTRALAVALALAVGLLAFAFVLRGYYGLPIAERDGSPYHDALRPSGSVGLPLGIGALLAVAANLAYLVRRSPRIRFMRGALSTWMSAHVATGILSLLLALAHGAMTPRDTPGGHAFIALCVLVFTGGIGRYLYSFVPRAANGRELELDELRDQLARLSGAWDGGQRVFGERARARVQELIEEGRWRAGLVRRIATLLGGDRRLRRVLGELGQEGLAEGLSRDQVAEVLDLARRAHHSAVAAAHYEEVRGVLSSWRWLHRWVALALVLLVIAHVVSALAYGDLWGRGR